MGNARVTPNVRSALKTRQCGTRFWVAQVESELLSPYDNNKQGLIVQNQSPTSTLYLTFGKSTDASTAIQVPPTGNISFDFAVSEGIWAFSSAADCPVVILEITGFDALQMLQIRLMEEMVDRQIMTVDLLSAMAEKMGVARNVISAARSTNQ